jgi:hypothetical protein
MIKKIEIKDGLSDRKLEIIGSNQKSDRMYSVGIIVRKLEINRWDQ